MYSSLASALVAGSSWSNPSVGWSKLDARLLDRAFSCLVSSNAFKTRCSRINLCAANAVFLDTASCSNPCCLSVWSLWRSSASLRSCSRCFFFSSSFNSFKRTNSSASFWSTSFLILSRSAFWASLLLFSSSCIFLKSSFSSCRFRRASSSSAFFNSDSLLSVSLCIRCLASTSSVGGDSTLVVFVCGIIVSTLVCFLTEGVFPPNPLVWQVSLGLCSFSLVSSLRISTALLLSMCFFAWIRRATSASFLASSSLAFCLSISSSTKLFRFSAFRFTAAFVVSFVLRITGWVCDWACGRGCLGGCAWPYTGFWTGRFSTGLLSNSSFTPPSPSLKSITLPRLVEILSPSKSPPSLKSLFSSNIGFWRRSLFWKADGCSSFFVCFNFCFSISALSFSLIFSISIRVNSSRILCSSSSCSITLPASALDSGAFFTSCRSCAKDTWCSSFRRSSSNVTLLCSANRWFSFACSSSSLRAVRRISSSNSLCFALSFSFLFFSSKTKGISSSCVKLSGDNPPVLLNLASSVVLQQRAENHQY